MGLGVAGCLVGLGWFAGWGGEVWGADFRFQISDFGLGLWTLDIEPWALGRFGGGGRLWVP